MFFWKEKVKASKNLKQDEGVLWMLIGFMDDVSGAYFNLAAPPVFQLCQDDELAKKQLARQVPLTNSLAKLDPMLLQTYCMEPQKWTLHFHSKKFQTGTTWTDP